MRKTSKRPFYERTITISELLKPTEAKNSVNTSLQHCDVYFHGEDLLDSMDPPEGLFVLLVDKIDNGAGYRRFNLHHCEPFFSSRAEREVFNILRRFLGRHGEIGASGRTTLVKTMWMIMKKAYNKTRPFDSMLKSYRSSKR